MSDSDEIRVFISYSHDSKEHEDRVVQLAKRLEKHGIECSLDKYETSPLEGWPRWTTKQIKQAKFVLVVCTKIYQERYENVAEPGTGKGAKWEGLTITQQLYEDEGRNSKFIPVVFSEDDIKYIPGELRRSTWYVLNDDGYLELYRHITGQPHVRKGPLGERLILPPDDDAVSNAATSEPPAGPAQRPEDLPPPPEGSDKRPSHEQVLEVLNSIKKVVGGTSLDRSSTSSDELDPFTVVRHHLFSTALMSQQIPSIMLGMRDTHRLYLYRDRLKTTPVEVYLLLRMLINDAEGLIPGWYWFSWLDETTLKTALFDFALRDRNATVRARAWEILAAARIPPVEDASTWDEYLKYMASEESHVKKAGLIYLGAVGGKRDLPTIKGMSGDSSVSSEPAIARLLVLARTNPSQVLTESIPKYLPEKKRILSELKANAGNIRKEALLRALQSADTDEDIKFLAIEELKRSNELTNDIASSLLENSSGRVAEVCYRHLIEQGESFSATDIYLKVGDDTYNRQHDSDYFFRDPPYADAKAVILELYKNYTEKDLWALVDWQADIALGDVAYKALALYFFNEVSSRVRDDLHQEFNSYADPYFQAARAKWAKWHEEEKARPLSSRGLGLLAGAWRRSQGEKERTPEDSANSETEGVKSKYIAAALAGVARNGEADDIIFGRRYLKCDDYDVLVEAVKVIERFGDEDDIQNLIDVAKKKEGALQARAALAALKLSPDVKETARTLLQSAKDDLASVVVGYLVHKQDVTSMSDFLEPLLREESDVVRRKVTAFFANKFTEEQLQDLLSRYTSLLPYYYDVVCWLDKVLYAPSQLKRTFARQLAGELQINDSDI